MTGSSADLKRLGEQAVAAHKAGRLEEAERLYLQIRAAAPDDFTASYMLGVLRFNAGRDDDAAQLLGIAVRQNPGAIGPLIFWGFCGRRTAGLAMPWPVSTGHWRWTANWSRP